MSLSTLISKPIRMQLAGTVLGFVATAFGWLALVQLQKGAPYEPQRWNAEAIAVKTQAAQKMLSPRLIFAGGSGVHFGLNAALAQRKLDMPAVNLGAHAGLMLDHLVYLLQNQLRPGDTVILSLEYPYYEYNGQLDHNLPAYAFAYDPNYIGTRSFLKRLQLYLSLPLTRIGVGLLSFVTPPARYITGYQSSTVDPITGDETANRQSTMDAIQRSKATHQSPISFLTRPFAGSPQIQAELRAFSRWCKDRGIRIYVAFPPTVYHSGLDENLISKNSLLLRTYLHEAGLVTLGKPEDFRYETDLIYDTAWHLNDVGREKHTGLVLELLNQVRANAVQ